MPTGKPCSTLHYRTHGPSRIMLPCAALLCSIPEIARTSLPCATLPHGPPSSSRITLCPCWCSFNSPPPSPESHSLTLPSLLAPAPPRSCIPKPQARPIPSHHIGHPIPLGSVFPTLPNRPCSSQSQRYPDFTLGFPKSSCPNLQWT